METQTTPMALTAQNVEAVFMDCLFNEGEDSSNHVPAHAVMLHCGFHPGRLKDHQQDIRDLLDGLPPEFHQAGGHSFMAACETKEGRQWGEHQSIDQLLALGLASKQVTMPLATRELWSALPGGMPYFRVHAPGADVQADFDLPEQLKAGVLEPKQESIQEISDRFNADYVKACNTSQPDDWGAAALTARQLVHAMGEQGLIQDNFEEVQG